MKPTRNDSLTTPYKPVTPLGFDPAYWNAIARFGVDDFAAAIERYLRMQRADYDTLRGYAQRYFSGRDLATIQALIDSIQTEQDPLLSLAPQLGGKIQFGAARPQDIPQPAMIDQPTEPQLPPVVSADEPSRPAGQGMTAPSEYHGLSDIDLFRISDNRGELRVFRLWTCGHELNRAGADSGKVEKAALLDHVTRLGIINSKRTFDDILAAGDGLYFTQAYHRNAENVETLYIHLVGWARLAKEITIRELAKEPVTIPSETPCQTPITMHSVDSNRPGSTRVWLDLRGSIADYRATGYAAWLAVKAEKYGYVDISRRVLQALWRHSRTTLIQMEKRARVPVEPVYCEHHDPDAPLVPSYAYPALDEAGRIIATWRDSNRYLATPVNIHQHGGQRRKVRKLVNAEIPASNPALDNGGGMPRGRRNFDHGRHGAKCIEVREDGSKRYGETYTRPAQLLKAHIKNKHKNGVVNHRHSLYVGFRYGVHIREMSTGDQFRSIDNRRDLHAESTQEFRDLRTLYRRGWGARWL